MVEVLLKHGADADAKDAEGDTSGDVIGQEIEEGTRQTVHDLLEQHSAAMKADRVQRNSCRSVPSTTGLQSGSERSMTPSFAACSESPSEDSGQNLRLPNLRLMPSAATSERRAVDLGDKVLGGGASGLEGDGGGGDFGSTLNISSSTGGGADMRSRRRASYSNAAHIRVSLFCRLLVLCCIIVLCFVRHHVAT